MDDDKPVLEHVTDAVSTAATATTEAAKTVVKKVRKAAKKVAKKVMPKKKAKKAAKKSAKKGKKAVKKAAKKVAKKTAKKAAKKKNPRSRSAEPLERFRAKWIPVRVKKTHQNNTLEPGSDSIRTDKAPGKRIRKPPAQTPGGFFVENACQLLKRRLTKNTAAAQATMPAIASASSRSPNST